MRNLEIEILLQPLGHDPEKACPGLDPGVESGFPKSMPSGLTRGIMLKTKDLDRDPIQLNWITV
jgi:hypothetical protein